MTPFASVALFRRNGSVVFKPPRKERPGEFTQARKAAMRFWSGNVGDGDKLVKVFVVREFAGKLVISERTPGPSTWATFSTDAATATKEPHLAAAMAELGIDASAAPPPVPDVLVINGHTYRKDI